MITITANGASVPFYATLTSTYAYIGQTVVQLWTSALLETVNNVDASSAVTLTFSDAVDIVSILNGCARVTVDATGTPVPVTMSADGRTATLTPQAPLAAGTQYRLEVDYSVAIYDQAGKYLSSGGGAFRFVTQ
jgi:hypothetical protein